jgi:hypothetical protein
MNEFDPRNTNLQSFFHHSLRTVMRDELDFPENQAAEQYLVNLLLTCLHQDTIFRLRNSEGKTVTSVAEMLLEGDVRFNAKSFEREREVHRHIGDLLLFWSGIFPEFGRKVLQLPLGIDSSEQGRASYHIASTFDYDPYGEEAKIFRQLSDGFDAYRFGLKRVRASFQGIGIQGYSA